MSETLLEKITNILLEDEHPDEIDTWEQLPKDIATVLVKVLGDDAKKVKSYQVVKETYHGIEDFPRGVRIWYPSETFKALTDAQLESLTSFSKFAELQIGRAHVALYFLLDEGELNVEPAE